MEKPEFKDVQRRLTATLTKAATVTA
jgi:hypothetical protein